MVLKATNEVFSSLFSPVGDPVKNNYIRVDEKDGSQHLEKCGTTNIQEGIDSYAEQTDYTSLLEKMEKGDPVATTKAAEILIPAEPPVFGDDSAEISLRKICDARLTAKRIFDSAGGQKSLGMSFDEFLSIGEVQSILKKSEQKVEIKPDATKVENKLEGVTDNES